MHMSQSCSHFWQLKNKSPTQLQLQKWSWRLPLPQLTFRQTQTQPAMLNCMNIKWHLVSPATKCTVEPPYNKAARGHQHHFFLSHCLPSGRLMTPLAKCFALACGTWYDDLLQWRITLHKHDQQQTTNYESARKVCSGNSCIRQVQLQSSLRSLLCGGGGSTVCLKTTYKPVRWATDVDHCTCWVVLSTDRQTHHPTHIRTWTGHAFWRSCMTMRSYTIFFIFWTPDP